ncbi:MAG: acetylornithine transaminase [Capsulimonadaceae bacterium]
MTQTLYTMDSRTGRIEQVWDATQVRAWDDTNVMHTYSRLPVMLVRGAGARVWDHDGKEYLDFLAGIAVNGVGHCHPKVVRAIQEQAGTLIHASNLYLTGPQAALAAKLCGLSDFTRVFFCNSGAEANEAAIKIARKRGKVVADSKFKIVTAHRSFHGRTMATVTATGQPKFQIPFAPMLPGFEYVPYNDPVALAAAVDSDTCAVLLEPIQGEGGVHPATPEYLTAARSACDRHGALLVFDEVQTGMGRTGKWWAYQHYGVVPDVMTLAKSLGGGMPIGACLARGEAAECLVPGDHGSTFAGNPLASSAALATLDAIDEEHLTANAHAMGAYLTCRLSEALGDRVLEIRGLGLMLGVELARPEARRVVVDALAQGLIVNAVGDTTLRLLPPLVIDRKDVDQAVDILSRVV